MTSGRYHSSPQHIHTFTSLNKWWYILFLDHNQIYSNALPSSATGDGHASKSPETLNGFVNSGYISDNASRPFPLIPAELMVAIVFGIIETSSAFLCMAAILVLLTDRNKRRVNLTVKGNHKVEDDTDTNLRKELSSAPIVASLDATSSDTTTSSIQKKRPSWVPGTSFFKETGLVQGSTGSIDQGPSHQIGETQVAPTEERKMLLANPNFVEAVPGAKSQSHPAHEIIPISQIQKQEQGNAVADGIHNTKEEYQGNKVSEASTISHTSKLGLQSSRVDNQGQKLDEVPSSVNDTAALAPKKKKKSSSKLSKGRQVGKSDDFDQSQTDTDNKKIVTESSSESLKVDQSNERLGQSTNQHQTKTDTDKSAAETGVLVTENSRELVPDEVPNSVKDTAALAPKKKKNSSSTLSKGRQVGKSDDFGQSQTDTDNKKIVTESSSKSLKVDQSNERLGQSTNQHQTKTDTDKSGAETGVLVTESSKKLVPKDSGNNILQEKNQEQKQTESNTITNHGSKESHSQHEHTSEACINEESHSQHEHRSETHINEESYSQQAHKITTHTSKETHSQQAHKTTTHISKESHSQQDSQHKTQKLATPKPKTRQLRRVFEQDTIDKGGKKFLARIESSSSEQNPEGQLEKNSQKEIVEGNSGVNLGHDTRQDNVENNSAVQTAINSHKAVVQESSTAKVERKVHHEIISGPNSSNGRTPPEKEGLNKKNLTAKDTSKGQNTIVETVTTTVHSVTNNKEDISTKHLVVTKGQKDLGNPKEILNQGGLYEFPKISSKESGQNSQEESFDKTNDVHVVTQLGEAH